MAFTQTFYGCDDFFFRLWLMSAEFLNFRDRVASPQQQPTKKKRVWRVLCFYVFRNKLGIKRIRFSLQPLQCARKWFNQSNQKKNNIKRRNFHQTLTANMKYESITLSMNPYGKIRHNIYVINQCNWWINPAAQHAQRQWKKTSNVKSASSYDEFKRQRFIPFSSA